MIQSTKEELKEQFKRELPEKGITLLDIAYTELNGCWIYYSWIFYFQGSPKALEYYLQEKAKNRGVYFSIKIGQCLGRDIYYATFITDSELKPLTSEEEYRRRYQEAFDNGALISPDMDA